MDRVNKIQHQYDTNVVVEQNIQYSVQNDLYLAMYSTVHVAWKKNPYSNIIFLDI